MGIWTPGPGPTAGNDTFTGDETAEVASGGDGNDTLSGNGGNDTLNGDAGDDVLTSGAGLLNFLNGGAGDDLLQGGTGQDTLEGGDGADVINGGAGLSLIVGGAGDDVLNGEQGDDFLTGGAGRDTFVFNVRDFGFTDRITDFESGEAGDLIDLSFFNIANLGMILPHMTEEAGGTRITLPFNGGAFSFLIESVLISDLTAANFVFGAASEDLDVAGSGALFGGSGDDLLTGGRFDDLFDGGAGADRFHVAAREFGNDTIFNFSLSEGDRLVLSTIGVPDFETLAPYVTEGPDGVTIAMFYRGFSESIFLEGVSWFDLANGAITFSSLDIPLTISGAGQDDVLFGAHGDDVITSGDGDDELNGGGGIDYLWGQAGNDLLRGGRGNDRLEGGVGTNLLYGGEGADMVSYRASANGVWVDLTAGAFSSGNVWDTFFSIEGIEGSLGNDTLFGDAGSNRLEGSAGDDVLVGRDGADFLHGGQGDDWFVGGAGADSLEGDLGIDTYSAAGDLTGATVQLGSGWAQDGGGAIDLLYDIENILGSGFGDTLVGSAAANSIDGGAGDDWIVGEAGDDLLAGGAGVNILMGGEGVDLASYASETGNLWVNMAAGIYAATGVWDVFQQLEGVLGGSGNDSIFGNGSDNVLRGAAGADILVGLAGSDRLEGGAGADWIVGGDGNDRLVGGDGVDSLTGGAGADTFDLGANAVWDVGFDFNTAEDRFSLAGLSWLGFVTLDADGDGQSDDTLLGYAGGNFVALNVAGLTLAQWNALVDAPAAADQETEMALFAAIGEPEAPASLARPTLLWPDNDDLRGLAPELRGIAQDEAPGWGLFG